MNHRVGGVKGPPPYVPRAACGNPVFPSRRAGSANVRKGISRADDAAASFREFAACTLGGTGDLLTTLVMTILDDLQWRGLLADCT
ncbi:MAG TPA: hypothetical protein VHF69_12950, partial [Candidatus Synoicihabitans sp.]|nr:hypothetical protein [Candidatus Synoicihabitans sp.]